MPDETVRQRVHWTEAERTALIRRCQSLRAEFPAIALTELLATGQEILPPERRRPSHAPLRTWLSGELRALAENAEEAPRPLAGLANVDAAPQAVSLEPHPAPESAPTPEPSATVSPAQTPQVAALVETGVQVLLGILGDPRVKVALERLLARSPESTAIAEEDVSKRHWVVVAGIPSTAVGAIQSALDGAVAVRFWSPDQPREQLLEMLPDARLVIGMPDGLTPAAESALQKLGSRYVRHHSGVPGLYRRLAEEALG